MMLVEFAVDSFLSLNKHILLYTEVIIIFQWANKIFISFNIYNTELTLPGSYKVLSDKTTKPLICVWILLNRKHIYINAQFLNVNLWSPGNRHLIKITVQFSITTICYHSLFWCDLVWGFCSSGVWIQDLVLAASALPLEHSHICFCF
jgi:hypothetical protein